MVLFIIQTLIIAFAGTFYLTKVIGSKEVFFLWMVLIYSTKNSVYAIIPCVTRKTFGQKDFTSIYGAFQVIGVGHFFYYNLFYAQIFCIFKIPYMFLSGYLSSQKDFFGWLYFFVMYSVIGMLSNFSFTFFYFIINHKKFLIKNFII